MKRTFVVLLAALVVLAAILIKKRSAEKTMSSEAMVFDSSRLIDVISVRVTKRPDTSAITKKDGPWIVSGDGFPVDTAKANKFLKNIFTLQSRDVVSHNPARYAEYGLDSIEGKHVTLLDRSGQSVIDVIVGKTSAADYSSLYWRFADKPDVFRSPGNYAWEISAKNNEWKEKKLIQVNVKELKYLETTWKDTTGIAYHYKLEAINDTTWKMLEPADSVRVNKAAIVEMTTRFGDIAIDEFTSPLDTNIAKVNVDSPMVWIKGTLKNGKSMELKASKPLGGYAYTVHPNRKELVKLSSWRFDAFKKKPMELLVAPPKPDSTKGTGAAVQTGSAGLPVK